MRGIFLATGPGKVTYVFYWGYDNKEQDMHGIFLTTGPGKVTYVLYWGVMFISTVSVV
jgi:hypothetical protein